MNKIVVKKLLWQNCLKTFTKTSFQSNQIRLVSNQDKY